MKSTDQNNEVTDKRLADYLHHHYQLEMYEAKPIQNVILLKTNAGKQVLKRVGAGEKDRWKLIEEWATFMKNHMLIPHPIRTKNNQLTFHGYQDRYTLLSWIPAKPIRLKTTKDWYRCSQTIAYLHRYSTEFKPSQAYRKYQRTGKWYADWKNAYRQLELFQLAARLTKQPTEVDQSWLEVAGYQLGVMESLLKYFENIGGDQCCKTSQIKGRVCHGNFNRHNFLADNQSTYVIDWNQMVLDVRSRDLAQWLRYAYRRTQSQSTITAVLQGFQQYADLTEEESALVYARLIYPERLIRVLQKVYEDQSLPIAAGAPSIGSAAKWEEMNNGLIRQYTDTMREEFGIQVPQIEWFHR